MKRKQDFEDTVIKTIRQSDLLRMRMVDDDGELVLEMELQANHMAEDRISAMMERELKEVNFDDMERRAIIDSTMKAIEHVSFAQIIRNHTVDPS